MIKANLLGYKFPFSLRQSETGTRAIFLDDQILITWAPYELSYISFLAAEIKISVYKDYNIWIFC